MKKPLLLFGMLLILQISCQNNDSDPIPVVNNPTKAVLVYPYENSECNEGTDITETQSTILFEWKPGDYTDVYELIISNLLTAVQTSYTTSENKMPVVLERGTPYAWLVVSSANSSDSTAQSEIWKFYNAGAGIESYAPFPAEIIAPAMAETIAFAPGGITLDWDGSDVDNDIGGYDVYFGTANPPGLLESDLQESLLTGVQVASDKVYYWRVITTDKGGNSSSTVVFQFRIQ